MKTDSLVADLDILLRAVKRKGETLEPLNGWFGDKVYCVDVGVLFVLLVPAKSPSGLGYFVGVGLSIDSACSDLYNVLKWTGVGTAVWSCRCFKRGHVALVVEAAREWASVSGLAPLDC